ncbi:MAG: sel1 repeat family protein [Firmicutes bacterium]|nr:sel1 repeat family protein [Bacillota bacterium]
MKKKYIKLNNNDDHLSLGNLFRLIKESSKNKSSAMQSEIFCTLFEVESINDTTVNNYCVGCRGISSEYKQIFLNKLKKYKKNNNEFADNIINLLNIMDGVVYTTKEKINFINNNVSAVSLSKKLYNIAKNDKDVNQDLVFKINDFIKKEDYYNALIEELNFIIIEKHQPIYESDLKKEVIETILSDTSISSSSLQEYLNLKLREGINYIYSLKNMAENGNAYANFEMGENEYYGYYKGIPRYNIAFEYLKKAADMNHATANYMIGKMYINGIIGTLDNKELEKGYEYLKKAYSLGNIAACNSIGNMYKNGVHPLKKDLTMAIDYYKKASNQDYAYSLNNLGKIEEDNKNYEAAFEYFLKSANLGESWACNKVGEYYRTGIIKKDMKEAYNYYNKGLDSSINTICYFNYYNLAKYFYMNGYEEIEKDEIKAVEYLNISSSKKILEANIELLYFYIRKYIETQNSGYYNKIIKLQKLIELHDNYNEKIKNEIEENIKRINKPELNIMDIVKNIKLKNQE